MSSTHALSRLAVALGLALAAGAATGEERPATLPRGTEGEVRPPSGAQDARRVAELRADLARWQGRLGDFRRERSVILARVGTVTGGPEKIVRVTARAELEWPEELRVAWLLLLDGSGHLRLSREVPASRSGDWHLEDDQLFDASGRTVAFERRSSTFQTGCEERPIRERSALFWEAGRLLARDHRIEDARGEEAARECTVLRADSELDATAAGWLRRRGLEGPARAAGVVVR